MDAGAALGTALGVNAEPRIRTVAAAVGVAVVIRESALALSALKLVGAAYLRGLGLQAVRAVHLQSSPDPEVGENAARGLMSLRSGCASFPDLTRGWISYFPRINALADADG